MQRKPRRHTKEGQKACKGRPEGIQRKAYKGRLEGMQRKARRHAKEGQKACNGRLEGMQKEG